MRYSFQKSQVGEFEIYRSEQVMGDVHLKRFLTGVTPQNQATLNVYVDGSFLLSGGQYTQVFAAGDTSLNASIPAYPGGLVFREEVLSPTGLRLCVSRIGGGAWSREKLEASAELLFDSDSVLIILSGSINGLGAGSIIRLPAGQTALGAATAVRCWVDRVD